MFPAGAVAGRQRRGYAMILVLLLITLLVAGGALMVQELVTRANLLRQETNELHLQSVLDSSVSKMMATYHQDPLYEGSTELELDGGKAHIAAEIVAGPRRKVAIAAEYHGLRRKIEVQLYAKLGEPVRLLDWKPVLGAH